MPNNYHTHTCNKNFASACASLSTILHTIQATKRWLVKKFEFILICRLRKRFCRHLRLACLSYLNLNLSLMLIIRGQPQTPILSCLIIQNFNLPLLPFQMTSYQATIYTSSSILTYPLQKIKQNPVGFTCNMLDSSLMKIKISFHLLSTSLKRNPLDLDCFLAELTNDLNPRRVSIGKFYDAKTCFCGYHGSRCIREPTSHIC